MGVDSRESREEKADDRGEDKFEGLNNIAKKRRFRRTLRSIKGVDDNHGSERNKSKGKDG